MSVVRVVHVYSPMERDSAGTTSKEEETDMEASGNGRGSSGSHPVPLCIAVTGNVLMQFDRCPSTTPVEFYTQSPF